MKVKLLFSTNYHSISKIYIPILEHLVSEKNELLSDK